MMIDVDSGFDRSAGNLQEESKKIYRYISLNYCVSNASISIEIIIARMSHAVDRPNRSDNQCGLQLQQQFIAIYQIN